MLTIDPTLAAAEQEPADAGLTTPGFRQELEETASPLLNKFDCIIHKKNNQIESFARRYNRAREDLLRQNATVILDESSRPSSTTRGKRSGSTSVVTSSTGDTERSPVAGGPAASSQASNRLLPTATRGEHRIALTDSTRNNGALQVTTSSTSLIKPTTTNEKVLEIKVKLRLIPVIKLLTTSDITPAVRSQAQDLAHSALRFAKEENASDALMARCSFYIAHTHYDREDRNTVQDVVNWFERAAAASEAGYPEGQWAQEWLNRYHSLTMEDDSRPSTAGSWMSSIGSAVWNAVWSMKSSAVPTSALGSPTSAQQRPETMSRHYSADSAPRKQARGERIPSFTTASTTTTASSVRRSSNGSINNRDHHGAPWSPKSLWGKGEILPGRRFERTHSPEPVNEEDEEDEDEEDEDEEAHLPVLNDVRGGFVEAGALSPAMKRSSASRPSISHAYIPPGVEPPLVHRAPRNTNFTSPPESPSSPGSSNVNAKIPSRSHYFVSNHHSRAQSTALDYPSQPLPFSPQTYAVSEGAVSPRNRKRGSLSLFIKATGLDVHRRRDEAAQMEEGESPAFVPKRESEAGLWRRRSSDVIGKEGEV